MAPDSGHVPDGDDAHHLHPLWRLADLKTVFLEPQNGIFWVGCVYGRNDDAGRFAWFCGAAAEFIRIQGLRCGPAPAAAALTPLLGSDSPAVSHMHRSPGDCLPEELAAACLLLPQGAVCRR